jgi:hypothetical protein
MRHIPQVVNANPAFIPLGRVNISVPGFGSSYVQAGKSSFVTKDVASVDSSGTLRLDVDKFLNGLSPENTVYAGFSAEALHIGFSAGKNYFFLSSNDRIDLEFQFPKSMAILISEVYEDLGIPDGYREINDTKVNYSHIREYSFGWARRINKDLNVGIRGKLLSGIMSVQTHSTAIVIEGVTPSNELSGLIDINMQTSGMQSYVEDPLSSLAGYSNYGYSLDFGFDYRITRKIKVAASVIDLMGTVTWKDNVQNYKAEDVRVDFNTVDWASVISPRGGDGLTGMYDSIVSNVDPEAVDVSYQTTIPTKAMGSFTYYLTPKIEATIIGQGIFGDDFIETKLRVGIQGRIKRFFNYMVSYAIIDSQESYSNLGVGFALNFGPIQIHALTDNIFDPLLYSSEFNPSLRAGINLTFGRDYE